MNKNGVKSIRALCASAILGALSFVLMLLDFSMPFIIPSFIKFDFSELPALIGSFAFGPLWGVLICLVKNLLHLFVSTTSGVGELSNFLLGAVFTGVCGLVYRYHRTRKGALVSALIGAAVMAVVSVPINYYLVYPFYVKFYGMPLEAIVDMYKAILPSADTLIKDLLIFNLPFNIVKGLADTIICFLIYKHISPILKYGVTGSTEKPVLDKKRVLIRRIIIIVISVAIVLASIIPIFHKLFTTNVDFKEDNNKSKQENDVDMTKVCDMLDYSILTTTTEQLSNSIVYSFLVDADSDGRDELIFYVWSEVYDPRGCFFIFETAENAIMSVGQTEGAAGSVHIAHTKDLPIALNLLYGSGYTSDDYYKWTGSEWEEYAAYADREVFENGTSSRVIEEATINGVKYNSHEEYKNALEARFPEEYRVSTDSLKTNYFETSNPKRVIEDYSAHLDEYSPEGYECETVDYDGDGEDEYLFTIHNYASLWTDNLSVYYEDNNKMQHYLNEHEDIGSALIYADTNENGIVFYTLGYWNSFDSNTRFNWEDQILYLTYTYYGETDYPSGFINGEDQVVKYFCPQIELVKQEYSDTDPDAETLYQAYANYLKRYGYREVFAKYVDICDVPGKEVVYVCSSPQSMSQTIRVCALYCGKIVCLYDSNYTNDAFYITTENDKNKLLIYTQWIDGNQKNLVHYEYYTICYDEKCNEKQSDKCRLDLNYNSTPSESDNAFFAELKAVLKKSIVCYDIYELTGYQSIPINDVDFRDTESKYLYISNCNTNKIGFVHVNSDSWLNFREGPNIKSNQILMDSSDKESYVKQMNGAAVTVLETVNTGDSDNPVWVKIRIKYSDRELTGYSSQKYIDIADIKHVSVGEDFTVTAETNGTGLEWSSSDPNILSIDLNSGRITAKKKGLVMIKVVSDFGMEDSCLIMVD